MCFGGGSPALDPSDWSDAFLLLRKTGAGRHLPLKYITITHPSTHRTGREEPILALSLEPDDPRITFSLMGNDPKLSGAHLFQSNIEIYCVCGSCLSVYLHIYTHTTRTPPPPTPTLYNTNNETGPGVCAMSNDVENPITACKLSKTKEGKTIYYKVRGFVFIQWLFGLYGWLVGRVIR